jgi:hypothetical protein
MAIKRVRIIIVSDWTLEKRLRTCWMVWRSLRAFPSSLIWFGRPKARVAKATDKTIESFVLKVGKKE